MKSILNKHLLAAFVGTSIFVSCSSTATQNNESNSIGEVKTPKYVFYFVGDGMSTPQINMAEKAATENEFVDVFNTQTCGKYSLKPGKLFLRQFTAAGFANTHAENRYITCSAAAATALSTGSKTTINTISMNGERTAPLTSVAEMARNKGMKVGVISSVSIDHATPACFYAHTEDRNNYETIGEFLLKSDYDFFGGGFTRWDKYKKTTLDSFKIDLKSKGYTITTTKQEFDNLKQGSGKVLATIARTQEAVVDGNALPYNIDLDVQKSDDDRIILAEFVKKAIDLLYNEDKGFFLFTEGGKIDWADHANDAVSNIYETIALDYAIGVAIEFYKQHPNETLIVFTGDHECGGLTLGFAGTHYESAFNLMKKQKTSFLEFTDMVKAWAAQKKDFKFVLQQVKDHFGLGSEGLELSDYETKRLKDAYEFALKNKNNLSNEENYLYYGGYEPVTVTATHILDNKAGVDWASYSHTALPVPVFAIGCGADLFNGYYDNTDIPKKIMQIAGLK